ncbi:hypothetical protein PFISCL1PPCAC_3770 [Pristionchus fissidentatus]|uniref:SAYSvFN domain-containing protein n=1 Tax=Pristionchus fissidentatus TaxID=1538716 RepID=A0AAV5V235_9BILA|nr:hypothetical protein PFISCL1PPCAC_3770 [Pristionchus fissidentatus]
MDRTRAELEAYRQRKREEAAAAAAAAPTTSKPAEDQVREKPRERVPERPWIAHAYQLLDLIDPLDCWPLRQWRSSYDRSSTATLAVTALVYLIGQIYFIWIEFGSVFFVFACLTAICLGLGSKRQGEISAYSVFNSNCERLLGSMTAEHFERDMLNRKK